jgi:hypothetical protein
MDGAGLKPTLVKVMNGSGGDGRSRGTAVGRGAEENHAREAQERPLPRSWWGRGENASSQRRAELRNLAERQIEAAVASAKLALEASQADVLTKLVAGGLRSEEAHAFLESMPTAEQLMPPLGVGELQKLLKVYEE